MGELYSNYFYSQLKMEKLSHPYIQNLNLPVGHAFLCNMQESILQNRGKTIFFKIIFS